MPDLHRPDRVGVQDRPVHLLRRPQQATIGPLDLGRRPGVERILAPGGRAASTRAPGRAGRCAPPGPPRGTRFPLGPHAPRAPAAARCGPAPGGRLHPRADPARGSCCTAFVTGPVLPPDRRLGRRQPHGAPTTRSAPPGRRSGRRKHRDGGDIEGPAPPRWPVPVHRPRRTTRRRGHRSHRPEPWAPPTQAPPPRPWASPCKRGARSGATAPGRTATTPGTATAQWVNRCQPHPTPPRQPQQPLTRRRRTPPPSQPHHHHRRGTRHGITNPPQNPGRSTSLQQIRTRPCPGSSQEPRPHRLALAYPHYHGNLDPRVTVPEYYITASPVCQRWRP